MINQIMGAVIGLCLFIIPLWAYRKGLQDGLALNQGKSIEPIKTPVQAFTEIKSKQEEKKEAKSAEDRLAEGLANIMAYDGTPQPLKVGEI